MEEQGLTLRALAEQAGVDDGYLARVLTRRKKPSEAMVLRVALALGLPQDYFIEYRRAAVEEHLKTHPQTVNRVYGRLLDARRKEPSEPAED